MINLTTEQTNLLEKRGMHFRRVQGTNPAYQVGAAKMLDRLILIEGILHFSPASQTHIRELLGPKHKTSCTTANVKKLAKFLED
jgi:hypothetical protein